MTDLDGAGGFTQLITPEGDHWTTVTRTNDQIVTRSYATRLLALQALTLLLTAGPPIELLSQ